MQGHVLVVLAEVKWRDLLIMCWSMLKKALWKGKRVGTLKRSRLASRRSVSHFVTEQEYRKHEQLESEKAYRLAYRTCSIAIGWSCMVDGIICYWQLSSHCSSGVGNDLDLFQINSHCCQHLKDIPEDSEDYDGAPRDLKNSKFVADTHKQSKKSFFTRTLSIALGVDRIDEYSKVEITTPWANQSCSVVSSVGDTKFYIISHSWFSSRRT